MHKAPTLHHLYSTEIQPVLAELETERRNVYARALVSGVLIVLGLLLLGAAVLLLRWSPILLIFGLILGVIVWFFVNSGRIQRYRLSFKQRVIHRLVQHYNADLSYHPDQSISMTEFRASQIYRQRIDRYNGEDLIEGHIGATAFRFSEVHAEYKTTTTDSKGRTSTRWHTIFRGIYFIADFNKHFDGLTLVLPDSAQSMFGRLGQTLQDWGSKLGAQPGRLVKLENLEFERMFAVYASDQVEARYILSPSLMERLVEFRQRLDNDVALAFVHSNVYIAMSTSKDHFEPPIWRSVDLSIQDIQEYLDDIQLAQDIVEELNLNTRIWSKR